MKAYIFLLSIFFAGVIHASNLRQFVKSAPIFLGYTTLTYNGNMGGMTGANNKCQIQYSGSHFCTVSEFLRSGNTVNPSSSSWLFSNSSNVQGAFGGTNYVANYKNYGCDGYTSSSNTFFSAGVSTAGAYNTFGCNVTRPLACCK